MMRTKPRQKLAKLLYLKLAITVPEIVWNILGTYWSFLRSSNCEEFVVKTVQGVVITGWILGVVVIIGIAIVFDPFGRTHVKSRTSSDLQSGESSQFFEGARITAKQTWEKR
jgi:sn1-specific diacylglycerol lipase